MLTIASVMIATPAAAQNDTILHGPVPAWVPSVPLATVPSDADGLAFMRVQNIAVHLDQQGESQHTAYRVKILHPSALQFGNLAIAWNPTDGPVTVHTVKIHRDGQVIDVLQQESFQILRREQKLEAAQLDGTLTGSLQISDLRVGDELEFSSTIRSKDPTLPDHDSGLLFFGPTPLKGRFQIGLSWDEGYKPHISVTRDLDKFVQKGPRSILARFDNPTFSGPPSDAPPRFGWQRIIEYSDFESWERISQYFAPIYADAATTADNSPIKAEAARIASRHSDELDRANAALTLVQQDVRYIYQGLSGGNLSPASAEETWKRRFGDCKGKTTLLLALLAELGVKAEAVLVNNSNTDDGLNQLLPNPAHFDHVLVRAHIGGKDYWLDGTLPPQNLAHESPILPYRWYLPLKAEGSPLVAIPFRPLVSPDSVQLHEVDARQGFDVRAKARVTSILRGAASLGQQMQLSGISADMLLTSLRQELIGDYWKSIDSAKWHFDPKANAAILSYAGTVEYSWDETDDKGYETALPGGGFIPPSKRERPDDQPQNVPFYTAPSYSCHVTTIRLPTSAPLKNWSHNDAFDQAFFGANYYRAFDIRDGAARMVRGYRVEQTEIDTAQAQKDNARLKSFDNSKAQLVYDPTTSTQPYPAEYYVPATYEIDWTAENVPCRAASQ